MTSRRRTLIVGAAGRGFHTFNTVYRRDPERLVAGFTSRDYRAGHSGRYPASLAGPLYPDGVPILPESALSDLIPSLDVQDVVLACTESPLAEVAEIASRALAAGADFRLVNPVQLMLPATKPVIAVSAACACAGKSPTARYLADLLCRDGLRVAVVRHPRIHHPVGGPRPAELRFFEENRSFAAVTQEEMRLSGSGIAGVFQGLDYEAVLAAAQADADALIWDGSGSDPPFLRPALHLVLVDPLLSGSVIDSFPGEVCLRMADAVIVTKCDIATVAQIEQTISIVEQINPAAQVFTADCPVAIEDPALLAGRTVAIVEEADSLRLDAIRPGAGMTAARQSGVAGIISPKPYAQGALASFYRHNPVAAQVLPVLSDQPSALEELGEALAAVPSEAIIDASRRDLSAVLPDKPVIRASYSLRPHNPDSLARLVHQAAGHTSDGA